MKLDPKINLILSDEKEIYNIYCPTNKTCSMVYKSYILLCSPYDYRFSLFFSPFNEDLRSGVKGVNFFI